MPLNCILQVCIAFQKVFQCKSGLEKDKMSNWITTGVQITTKYLEPTCLKVCFNKMGSNNGSNSSPTFSKRTGVPNYKYKK